MMPPKSARKFHLAPACRAALGIAGGRATPLECQACAELTGDLAESAGCGAAIVTLDRRDFKYAEHLIAVDVPQDLGGVVLEETGQSPVGIGLVVDQTQAASSRPV